MTPAAKRNDEPSFGIPQPASPAVAPPPPAVSADRCRQAAVDLQKQGRLEQAIRMYQRGLALDPSDAVAFRCLGTAYKTQGRLELAAACFQRAVALCPAFPEAWNNFGNTSAEQGDHEKAVACFRQAVAVQPQFAGGWFNLAQALGRLGRFDEAIAASRKAAELSPRSAEFYNGLGMALYDARQVDEAVAAYDEAIRIRPDFAPARYNRSHAWLLQGDYERAWPEYEWRWKLPAVNLPSFAEPRWDGTPRPESTILLDAEQGLGDTIQFVRYVPLVRERVKAIVIRCQKPLTRLLSSLPGVDRVVSRDEPLGHFDIWSPLLSVPLYFAPAVETIPSDVPYLAAEPALVDFWRDRLRAIDGFRVGINWQGNPAYPKDRFRSVPLQSFEPLARIPGVRLISLQKGAGTQQLEKKTFPVLDLGLALDEIHGPLLDTAAILQCLDLVVTSDTSLAHLAGALGVETWLAVPSVPEWRWLIGRDDSPWYPTFRLFRQGKPGEWDEVFSHMAARLAQRATAPGKTHPGDRQLFPSFSGRQP